MTDFIPTKRNNPCELCGDTSGDCRTTDDILLCMKLPDGGGVLEGYQYVKATKDGLWGIYAPSLDEYDPEERDRIRRQINFKKMERLRIQAEDNRNGLTIAERDYHIRKLSAALGLSSKHKAQLLERGLSEEAIAKGLFFSVAPKQEIPSYISEKLAGVKLDGEKKYLATYASGFACVAFDAEGRAIGFQIRNEDPDADNKYLWPLSEFGSHLQNGELPITTHGENRHVWNQDRVTICEGLLKPYIAAEKLHCKTIGASGGQHKSSSMQLRSALGQSRTLDFAMDAGDVLNPNVLKRWEKLLNEFNHNYTVNFLWWEQWTKADPDIDEIPDGVRIRIFSAARFRQFLDFNLVTNILLMSCRESFVLMYKITCHRINFA